MLFGGFPESWSNDPQLPRELQVGMIRICFSFDARRVAWCHRIWKGFAVPQMSVMRESGVRVFT